MTGPVTGKFGHVAQAIRFVGAGFDTTGYGGLTTSATGAVATVTGDDAIRQAVMLLLSTVPGERLMRPEYGCHLHRLLFAVNDMTTAGLATHYVRQAVTRWEPRLSVIDVDADAHPEIASMLVVTLVYRVKASLSTDTLVYPFDLAGGERP